MIINREDYRKCVDLQSECESLTIGRSIRLTGLIQENDSVGVANLLLELLIDNQKPILSIVEENNE